MFIPLVWSLVFSFFIQKWLERWTIFPSHPNIQGLEQEDEQLVVSNTDWSSLPNGTRPDIELTSAQTQAQLSPSSSEKLVLPPKLLLHSQHSVILDAIHTLFLLNPADESRTDQELERKIQLGNHLLLTTQQIFLGKFFLVF